MNTPVSESFLNKVAGLQDWNFIKKRLQHKCFPVKFAKFLRAPILKNIHKWLLLSILRPKFILKGDQERLTIAY